MVSSGLFVAGGSMNFVFGLLVSAVVAWLIRNWAAGQPVPMTAQPTEPFDGTEYRVGECRVFERRCESPRATVLCMPGYLEAPHYFTQYYADPTIQLVLVSSADYGQPFSGQSQGAPNWAQHAPTGQVGDIEYDAQVLALALEHLPKSTNVRVHGHSRGGAVVLEAARQRPDLFEKVKVLLECPVVPQGKLFAPVNAIAFWFWPLIMLLWRKQPISKQNEATWGRLDDARKKQLIIALPNNPNRARTAERNVKSIIDWSSKTGVDVYAKVHGAIIIADDDRVLDSVSMRQSAKQAPDLAIIDAKNSSHFPLFDAATVIPSL